MSEQHPLDEERWTLGKRDSDSFFCVPDEKTNPDFLLHPSEQFYVFRDRDDVSLKTGSLRLQVRDTVYLPADPHPSVNEGFIERSFRSSDGETQHGRILNSLSIDHLNAEAIPYRSELQSMAESVVSNKDALLEDLFDSLHPEDQRQILELEKQQTLKDVEDVVDDQKLNQAEEAVDWNNTSETLSEYVQDDYAQKLSGQETTPGNIGDAQSNSGDTPRQ